jgi:DNA polymerase I-like protein with 3'-5' exonuclease and polymerase domains
MAQDVLHLLAIRELQIQDLIETGQMPTAQLEFDCVPAFIDLELSGFRMDVEKWFEAANWYVEHIELCTKKMYELIGDSIIYVPAVKKGQPYRKEIPSQQINFSYDQLKALLYQKYNLPVSNTDRKDSGPILRGEMFADIATDESLEFIETLETATNGKISGLEFSKTYQLYHWKGSSIVPSDRC